MSTLRELLELVKPSGMAPEWRDLFAGIVDAIDEITMGGQQMADTLVCETTGLRDKLGRLSATFRERVERLEENAVTAFEARCRIADRITRLEQSGRGEPSRLEIAAMLLSRLERMIEREPEWPMHPEIDPKTGKVVQKPPQGVRQLAEAERGSAQRSAVRADAATASADDADRSRGAIARSMQAALDNARNDAHANEVQRDIAKTERDAAVARAERAERVSEALRQERETLRSERDAERRLNAEFAERIRSADERCAAASARAEKAEASLKRCVDALAGRYHCDGNSPVDNVVGAIEAYLEAEDALPESFDGEDYTLPSSVQALTQTAARVEAAEERAEKAEAAIATLRQLAEAERGSAQRSAVRADAATASAEKAEQNYSRLLDDFGLLNSKFNELMNERDELRAKLEAENKRAVALVEALDTKAQALITAERELEANERTFASQRNANMELRAKIEQAERERDSLVAQCSEGERGQLRKLLTTAHRERELAEQQRDKAIADLSVQTAELRAKLATAEKAWQLLAECANDCADWPCGVHHRAIDFIRDNPPPKEGA